MKNILKHLSVLLMISLSLSFCGSPSSGVKISDKEKILATIDNKKISLEDLKKDIEILPDEYKNQIRTPKEKENLLQDLIATELLYLAGMEKALDRDEKTQLKVEHFRKWLIRDLYISRFIKPRAVPTAAEIREYYEKHKKDKFFIKGFADINYIKTDTIEDANRIYSLLKNNNYKFVDFAKGKIKKIRYLSSGISLLRVYKDGKIPGIGEDWKLINFIFSLKNNEIAKPVKSDTGYYIIKTFNRKDDRYADLDAVKDDVKNIIEKEKFIRIMDKEMAALKKKHNVKTYPNLLK